MSGDRWRRLDFSEGSPPGPCGVGGTAEQRANTRGAKLSSKLVSDRTPLPFHERGDHSLSQFPSRHCNIARCWEGYVLLSCGSEFVPVVQILLFVALEWLG